MSDFDESKFQRDDAGKFSSTGGEGKQALAKAIAGKQRGQQQKALEKLVKARVVEPTPATTAKNAAEKIAEVLAKEAERFPEKHKNFPGKEQVQKNWEKQLKGRVAELSPEHADKLKAAMKENYDNPAFKAALAKFGGEAIIPVQSTQGGHAAERVGGATLVTARIIGEAEAAPLEAGSAVAVPGLAGTLRHEYGHNVWSKLSTTDKESFISSLPRDEDLGSGLSLYAKRNSEEAFSEAFSVVTHPDFDEAKFPKVLDALQKVRQYLETK